VTEHGDQVALAAGYDPQYAEAVLVVVEGDALDQAGQDLGRTRRRCARHPGIMEIGFLGRYQDRAGSVSGGARTGAAASNAWGVARFDRIGAASECRAEQGLLLAPGIEADDPTGLASEVLRAGQHLVCDGYAVKAIRSNIERPTGNRKADSNGQAREVDYLERFYSFPSLWISCHDVPYATFRCKSNIEMTALCKVEMTLPRVLGSPEVGRGGGVDKQTGVHSS
jgi:hypothetical protein